MPMDGEGVRVQQPDDGATVKPIISGVGDIAKKLWNAYDAFDKFVSSHVVGTTIVVTTAQALWKKFGPGIMNAFSKFGPAAEQELQHDLPSEPDVPPIEVMAAPGTTTVLPIDVKEQIKAYADAGKAAGLGGVLFGATMAAYKAWQGVDTYA